MSRVGSPRQGRPAGGPVVLFPYENQREKKDWTFGGLREKLFRQVQERVRDVNEAQARALIGRRVYHRAFDGGPAGRTLGRWATIETHTAHMPSMMIDPTAAHFTFAIVYDNHANGPAQALIDELDFGCDAAIEPSLETVAALEAKWRGGQTQDRISYAGKRT